MENDNKFLQSINDIAERLPITYRFVQSMSEARNLPSESYTPAVIEIKCFESKSIEPSGFYRPISKILNLNIHEFE